MMAMEALPRSGRVLFFDPLCAMPTSFGSAVKAQTLPRAKHLLCSYRMCIWLVAEGDFGGLIG